MTHHVDVARGRDIVARWCNLAERRLEHLTELFETGRWRRYHSELSFLENIQEAKNAVETWRSLATREASRDNSAIDISWLNSPRPLPPRRNPLSGYYVPPPPPRRAEVRMVPEIVEAPIGCIMMFDDPDGIQLRFYTLNEQGLDPEGRARGERS